MSFTIENATVTSNINGTRYVHDFVTNITISNPQENSLTVSPQGGGIGLTFRTNTTSPVASTMIIRNMPLDLLKLYIDLYKSQNRLDFMITDASTGERYDLNESIIRTDPTNTTIAEGESSLDLTLNISTPPSRNKHAGE